MYIYKSSTILPYHDLHLPDVALSILLSLLSVSSLVTLGILVLRNHVIYHIHVQVDDSRPAHTAFQLFETHVQFSTLPYALKQCSTDGRDECFGPSVKMVLSLQPTARNTLTYV